LAHRADRYCPRFVHECSPTGFTAAHVSDAIKAHPAAADSILKANGYTRESFQREMYDIAADSARSAAYVAAKRG
jgi:hypothetical protein